MTKPGKETLTEYNKHGIKILPDVPPKNPLRTPRRSVNGNRVYEKQCGRCFFCAIPIKKNNFTVDHMKPLAIGGENAFFNLQPSCWECNHEKGCEYPEAIQTIYRKAKERAMSNIDTFD